MKNLKEINSQIIKEYIESIQEVQCFLIVKQEMLVNQLTEFISYDMIPSQSKIKSIELLELSKANLSEKRVLDMLYGYKTFTFKVTYEDNNTFEFETKYEKQWR